jgi:hypothetical protein
VLFVALRTLLLRIALIGLALTLLALLTLTALRFIRLLTHGVTSSLSRPTRRDFRPRRFADLMPADSTRRRGKQRGDLAESARATLTFAGASYRPAIFSGQRHAREVDSHVGTAAALARAMTPHAMLSEAFRGQLKMEESNERNHG